MTIFTRVIEFLDGSDGIVEPIPSCVHSLETETERELQRLWLLQPNENVNRPDQAVVSIVGPAGTGKTTLLADLVVELEDVEVLVTSFSRSAAKAFREKCSTEVSPTTIYSLAHRVLSTIRTDPIQYLGKDHLAELKSMQIDLEPVEDFDNVPSGGSDLQLAFDLIRQAEISPAEAASKIGGLKESPADLGRLFETYQDYLSRNDLLDHASLLQSVIPACEYWESQPLVLVDEAQDLTPLEWKALDAITQKSDVMILCGDPAQSIHGWRGTSVEDFTKRDKKADARRQLVTVFRHGPEVAGYSEQVLQRVQGIPRRIPVEPVSKAGAVIPVDSLSGIASQIREGSGSWLILGRNRRYLRKAAQVLDSNGIIYGSSGGLRLCLPEEEESPAWQNWDGPRLAEGIRALVQIPFGGDDLEKLQTLLELLPKQVWRGQKKPEFFDFEQLTNQAVEKIESGKGFDLLRMHPSRVEKIQSWFNRDQDLLLTELDNPRVKLSTIHASKGLQADHVAVLEDWSRKSRKALDDPEGDEHRLAYVAVTRARERVFICGPFQGRGYQFPGVRVSTGGGTR
jgi:superfamily I DNA/RNA helicase